MPLTGEVIGIKFPAEAVDFTYGPVSTFTPSRNNLVAWASDSSEESELAKDVFHFALVTYVEYYPEAEKISLTVMSIVFYSSTPDGFAGTWNAYEWMCHQATDIQRLYHLPVPAIGCTPSHHRHANAPTLSFGS